MRVSEEYARRSGNTLNVLEYFRSKPLVWIPWMELAAIGGACAWRTRISNARKIVERDGCRIEWNGCVRKSEYRFVPYTPIGVDSTVPRAQTLFATLLLVLVASSVSAQSLKPIAYTAFVIGQGLDLQTTQSALSRGSHESNPILGSSIGAITIRKSLISAGVLICAHVVERHGKKQLANALRVIGGGVGVFAAVHNHGVSR